jgi:hypothetical protein
MKTSFFPHVCKTAAILFCCFYASMFFMSVLAKSEAQILYPLMQCTDIFFLKVEGETVVGGRSLGWNKYLCFRSLCALAIGQLELATESFWRLSWRFRERLELWLEIQHHWSSCWCIFRYSLFQVMLSPSKWVWVKIWYPNNWLILIID